MDKLLDTDPNPECQTNSKVKWEFPLTHLQVAVRMRICNDRERQDMEDDCRHVHG